MKRAIVSGAIGLLLCACGGSSPPAAAPKPVETTQARTTPPGSTKSAALRRADLQRVIAQGPGVFLQRISVEEYPVMRNGKFYGFKIAALHGSSWSGVDLKPGDVIMRVNDVTIERPEQALQVFRSLETAAELRVAYERNGQPREIRYPIADD